MRALRMEIPGHGKAEKSEKRRKRHKELSEDIHDFSAAGLLREADIDSDSGCDEGLGVLRADFGSWTSLGEADRVSGACEG